MTTIKGCNDTEIIVTYPIVGAIWGAEEFLRKKMQTKDWDSMNVIQEAFISKFLAKCKKEVPTVREIECIAHLDVMVVNEWLKRHGFSISLNPTSSEGISTASKLDLTGYWASIGRVSEVYCEDGTNYPGVKMDSGYTFFKTDGIENPIVRIKTEADDEVYVLMIDKAPIGFAMVDFIEDIQSKMKQTMIDHSELIFPMIDLDIEKSLDWILGMRLNVDSPSASFYEIAQALQQIKLKMNEKGFRVKSAAAIQMILGSALFEKAEPYIVDRPFLMWIRRPSLSKPLLVGYFNRDVWKNPEGLDM
ncbi:MAG: hypothetical protein ACFFED_04285 [Candidatus Thorarchaeota archaeon]